MYPALNDQVRQNPSERCCSVKNFPPKFQESMALNFKADYYIFRPGFYNDCASVLALRGNGVGISLYKLSNERFALSIGGANPNKGG